MTDFGYFVDSLFIIGSLVVLCQASTYTFGDDCSIFLKDIDEDDEVYVKYDGGEVSSYCEDISFNGKGEEILDEYKVCATPEYYEDPDCAIELKYTKTVRGTPLQTYTCSNPQTSEFCGGSEDFFYLYLETKSSHTRNARFKLKVAAVKTFDYGKTVGIIVGCVFGGLVVLSIIIGIVICIACRQKRSPGQVLNPTSGGAVPMTQVTGYPTQQYGMNQPTSFQTPQQFGSYPNQATGSYPTHQNGIFPTQQTGSNTVPSAPASGFAYNEPPSYNQVTASEPTKM